MCRDCCLLHGRQEVRGKEYRKWLGHKGKEYKKWRGQDRCLYWPAFFSWACLQHLETDCIPWLMALLRMTSASVVLYPRTLSTPIKYPSCVHISKVPVQSKATCSSVLEVRAEASLEVTTLPTTQNSPILLLLRFSSVDFLLSYSAFLPVTSIVCPSSFTVLI